MRTDTIPQEMRELKQWVVARNGSKVPFRADRYGAASSSDPSTWSDFETAVKTVEKGKADYLGFVFTGGIVGIDIDAGFTESGLLNELSVDCMRACQSFTERSRSGRGIHIYVRGELPFKGKNNGSGVEIYQQGRYFIVTGEKLVYGDLRANQEGIDYIIGKYFADCVREAKSGRVGEPIYRPQFCVPADGAIALRKTVYPPIPQGMRNMSLTSLAGQLHTAGCSEEIMRSEVLRCNEEACKPPLPLDEVESIIQSVRRYNR